MLTYEDFFSASDVAAYKRVKRGSMQIAASARSIVAGMVGGEVQPWGRDYMQTRRGVYRLCMSRNSDNSTERLAHERANATTVVMGDEEEMREFFSLHGLDSSAFGAFVDSVSRAL